MKFVKNLEMIIIILLQTAKVFPFKNNYFDTIVANHMHFLFKGFKTRLTENNSCLKEIMVRFYCTTYSKYHMQEISELAQNFDSRISLSDDPLPERFGLEKW